MGNAFWGDLVKSNDPLADKSRPGAHQVDEDGYCAFSDLPPSQCAGHPKTTSNG